MSRSSRTERPYVNAALFSTHYLDGRLRERDEWDCDDDARDAMAKLRPCSPVGNPPVDGRGDDGPLDTWLAAVLDVLGFGVHVEPTLPNGSAVVDVLLFESETAHREAVATLETEDATGLFERGLGLVETTGFEAGFDERTGDPRSYPHASHRLRHSLERTPQHIQWGILTDGRTWRLYGTTAYETRTYYEVDLPELLGAGDVEAFKYFYVFFRPAAFRDSDGTTFLDEVQSESEAASRALGEDLQDRARTALRVLGQGLLETNDLRIAPGDEDRLRALQDHSLVLLFRLLVVLSAEARGFVPPKARTDAEVEEPLGFESLRHDVYDAIGPDGKGFDDAFSEGSTDLWRRLQDVFGLVNDGQGALGIPPYCGNLFDDGAHEFLATHEVSDQYLAEALYRLSTTRTDERRHVLVDDADLDTRHLGGVHEHLLEHRFRLAPTPDVATSKGGRHVGQPEPENVPADASETVSEGDLSLVPDDGNRKTTGAYYTPGWVVTYIVEEAVGPLVDGIREVLADQGLEPGTREYLDAFRRRVKKLNILDPAVGSGHFLVETARYLTSTVMREVRNTAVAAEGEVEVGVGFEEPNVRREIAVACLYGVDIDEMAVELATVSVWLETLAADRQWPPVDQHLTQGDALVGTGAEGVEELVAAVDVTDALESLADGGSIREPDATEPDERRRRLVAMADAHTAEQFGLAIPDDAYARMAGALGNDDAWTTIEGTDWFGAVREMASERHFFHWPLAFPEVFDGAPGTDAGFDAVVGNPPYVQSKRLPDASKAYFNARYASSTGRWDLYCLFTERGLSLCRGTLSYIQPMMFLRRPYGEGLREVVNTNAAVREIVDLSDVQLFGDATSYVCLFTVDCGGSDAPDECSVVAPETIGSDVRHGDAETYSLANAELDETPWPVIPAPVARVLDSIPATFVPLESVTESISEGVHTGNDEVFFVDEDQIRRAGLERELLRPVLKGRDVGRYAPPDTDLSVLYPYENGTVIPASELRSDFPNVWEYLTTHESALRDRQYVSESKREWYELWCERTDDIYRNPKLLLPEIADRNRFTADVGGTEHCFNTKVKSIRCTDEYDCHSLLGILNSTLLEFVYRGLAPPKRGGYRAYKTNVLHELEVPPEPDSRVGAHADRLLALHRRRQSVDTDLMGYIAGYDDGPTLGELPATPIEGVADSVLTATTTSADAFETLRVTAVDIERRDDTLTIYATPYVKPTDQARGRYETNGRGYASLDPVRAMAFEGLSDRLMDLIEAFVPHAVANEVGGYIDTATKTISPLDRLQALTLPDPDDVAAEFDDYVAAVARAEELDDTIEAVDGRINDLVYELYGLTDEEIRIVEATVGDRP